ncbi:MAG: hypothetical protein SPK23_04580 [Eubacteriales bacterium]|nr:hypothetical protein [Clostridiales bacterium]MDY5836379.1 hypothetical protein [Eubacteriales bacterium]
MLNLTKGEKIFFTVIIISLLMVNPPILGFINTFAQSTPLMWGYPTLWLWLEFWYVVAIVTFLVGVLKLKNWQKTYPDDEEVK